MRLYKIIILLLFSIISFGQMPPKLVVGIVIDQMRYDYLKKFGPNFSNSGFNLILKKGANCTNMNYNYVPTYTGPGHASIYTGTTPRNHGIIANDWYNISTKKTVNCVEDKHVRTIGSDSREGMFSPVNLITSTITDQLKLQNRKSKVVAISIKNRGAILPGGHLSDGSFWYDYSSGRFITSSFYMNDLPPWLESFNKKKNASNSIKNWELLLDSSLYIFADESRYENLILNKTKSCFPYEFENYYDVNQIFPVSPQANTLLTDLAKEAIISEELGKDNSTDFLSISYSSTDIVGHLFGIDSRELEDMYYRLDLEISGLLKYLNKKVGKKNYLVFITADHAAVSVPQLLIDNHLPGGYFFYGERLKELNILIQNKFNTTDSLIERFINNQLYFNHENISKNQINLHDFNHFVLNVIKNWDEVQEAYSADQLYSNDGEGYKKFIQNGFLQERSGDIAFILKFGYLSKLSDTEESRKGTSHGSAYNYDIHVPMLWYGSHIPSKTIAKKYQITDIVPTLSNIMNIQFAGSCTGKPILEIFEK